MKNPLSYIEISKSALRNNIAQFRTLLPKGNLLVLVVKANAYGHGLKEVVKIANSFVDMFQVDDIEELREVRIVTNKRVLILGYIQNSDLEELADLNATLGVYNIETLKELERIGKKKNKKMIIHLKIDALLGRQGVLLADLKEILNTIQKSKYLILESIYSHFSNIEDTDNLEHAQNQFEYLMEAKRIVINFGFKNITHHISATSGMLSDIKNNWEGVLVRLGIGGYGLWPSEGMKKIFSKKIKLTPVLRWVSHIAQVKVVPKDFPIGYGLTYITKRQTKIAIIPQGYSDGYDRGLSNNSFVLIKGQKCSVLGRVAMNMFVVDVSSVKDVKLEDEVILLGSQNKREITSEMLAEKLNTINYEIVARLNPLIRRVIVK
ncbi:MAG: Alanine racemase [Candidatus Taylorbacteria bacterium]|nr:Alanine racemase [Candidatus Taylorbacteria bacterium]